MLLPESVLSNTDLDEKTDQIQVTVNERKYKNVEYDDNIIEIFDEISWIGELRTASRFFEA